MRPHIKIGLFLSIGWSPFPVPPPLVVVDCHSSVVGWRTHPTLRSHITSITASKGPYTRSCYTLLPHDRGSICSGLAYLCPWQSSGAGWVSVYLWSGWTHVLAMCSALPTTTHRCLLRKAWYFWAPYIVHSTSCCFSWAHRPHPIQSVLQPAARHFALYSWCAIWTSI